jgi:hypothetical protein
MLKRLTFLTGIESVCQLVPALLVEMTVPDPTAVQ